MEGRGRADQLIKGGRQGLRKDTEKNTAREKIDVIRLRGADGDRWREEYTRKTQRDSEVTG